MLRKYLFIVIMVLALTLTACGTSENDDSNSDESTLAGEQVYKKLGCAGCHSNASIAPDLNDLYGSEVILENGETVTADEDYIRESIVDPKAKIVEGYQAVMPDFNTQLSSDEVQALVEYIKSLSE